ncbi:glycosyltransferase [Cyclobacterium jeungdonense]|uniref:Glycosyltransferase n=1 Tax=Cyclobacterium jeungdonense TaxID=708087 RepID=A0ABT8CFM5_9BACT|nr:glycosyltransferase [Cyclobacterium jeungdonense]MDN3690573.1 glycosyltransferase [Cyclobacterium jeungdonense]
MKKILFLPKYPRKGASSRLRTYQFLPFWKAAGMDVTVSPFFTGAYLDSIYADKRPQYLHVLACYWRRCSVLMTVGRYDLICIEKELFPYLPAFPEWMLSRFKGYWVDYDDAVFHNYDLGKYGLASRLIPKKIDRVMQWAKAVSVGNDYLMERARLAGAQKVIRLPTVIDPGRYKKKIHQASDPVTIGWIGSPSTLKYLDALLPVLERLSQELDITLLLINGKKKPAYLGKVQIIPWTEEGEAEALLQMDIGMMPLPDNPWEKGKCAYKLIQYMACGLPVVASPVGMNKEVVSHGVNGFLAQTDAEWIAALSQLIRDWTLRKAFGEKGHQLVMENYTLHQNFEKMQTLVNTLGNETSKNG